MKKTLCMVFFLAVLAGTAGCGEKNNADTIEQTDTQTEKKLEEQFFLAEQDEQNYNVLEEYSEDDEYPELAAFLTEYYQIPEEECKETRYYYNYIDLNEDGTDEIVAVTIGDTISDTRGDVALILRPGENGQFEVLGAFSEIHTPVMISDDLEMTGIRLFFRFTVADRNPDLSVLFIRKEWDMNSIRKASCGKNRSFRGEDSIR